MLLVRFTALSAVVLLSSVPPLYGVPGKVRFNRDIRPIMSDTCFRCHGPDAKARLANLRLDIRDEALKTNKRGLTPIVPGDPDKSEIIKRIFAAGPTIMPPAHAHKELTQEQKETIKQWVAEGAAYEGHWSYEAVRRPSTPTVAESKYIRNPIDAFIQERLSQAGLKPSPEADRRTLLRRVTFDLTGLPPKPGELQAFLDDKSPNAYEKVVDRLLASSAYAEMQALRWLDAVRYADSAGFHGDNLWPAWPYRDYVLKAFRNNMPFDRFTREQLAGDLLPDATDEQRIASAYNRLNRASAEGGLQPEEYLAKYGADRVRTTATVWLGATMGCAECHDHKFDPFLAKDFYAMKAFFADIKETGLVPDRGERAWGSKLFLPTAEQERRQEEFEQQLEDAQEELIERAEKLRDRRVDWEIQLLSAHKAGKLAWQYQQPIAAVSANGTELKIYKDEPLKTAFYLFGSLNTETKKAPGLVVAEGPNPDNETFTVSFKPGAGSWTSLGLEAWQDESLPGNRLGRGYKGFILTEVEAEVTAPGQPAKKLEFVLATSGAFGEDQGYRALNAIDGDAGTGWGVHFGEARNPFLALRLAAPVETLPDSVVTVKLRHDSPIRRAVMGRFRVAMSSSPLYSYPEGGDSGSKFRLKEKPEDLSLLAMPVDLGIPADVLEALGTPEADRSEAEQERVLRHFAWSVPELQDPFLKSERIAHKLDLLNAQIPRVLTTERMRPRITRVLARGNFLDKSGEIVAPAIPVVFGKLNTGDRRANRLDLANWLVSKENPLTARTFANRTWRAFFGTGLSKVLEDLGSQGEWPTHPELLDWLAAEFMSPTPGEGTHGWDMRNLVRTIVTSHTYRQDSASTPELEEKDPDNRLLARQSRFRLDAEAVHDTLLAVSGLLADKFGGPSVRPKQPAGYLAAMNFPKRDYSEGRGTDLYRRALYTEWQRTFLDPSLLAFDAPTREECTVNRVNSNTPLQALVILNDPLYVEASRVFAENILESGETKLDGQLEWAFIRALNRTPEKAERQILATLYKNNLARFQLAPDSARELLNIGENPLPKEHDPVQLAALTTVARAILNLHEVITRN